MSLAVERPGPATEDVIEWRRVIAGRLGVPEASMLLKSNDRVVEPGLLSNFIGDTVDATSPWVPSSATPVRSMPAQPIDPTSIAPLKKAADEIPALEYVDQEKIPADLLCSICHMPYVEPRAVAGCGDVFCRDCIEKFLACDNAKNKCCPLCRSHPVNADTLLPQKKLMRMLEQYPVRCSLPKCSWTGPRTNFADHVALGCQSIACRNAPRCCWKGSTAAHAAHTQMCEWALLPCRFGCGVNGPRREMESHECRSKSAPFPAVLLSPPVRLNVGGKLILTSMDTLQKHPRSALAAFVSL